ncbi:amino acid ABC transporter permease [Microbacterium mangrovi]|uniref:amino acid ABC transporter permease n=1 Tax=Microbacterium mangrovi TaxID=1348253 RepID=UPI00068E9D94|nr:amino acid ABC transporter permease [Microbacterium mangrovi]
MNDFSWLYTWPQYIPQLLPGLWVAILMTVIACVGGYILGFFLALLVESPSRIVHHVAIIIVELGRGVPILVLLYVFYQGLPQLGILLDPGPAAIAGLMFSAAGYSSEMIRAGLNAVPKGQIEAADSLSLRTIDRYRFIVIPQAARISIPPLVNLTIIIFQATSLATVITVPEIMQHADVIGSVTFQYMSVYVAAGVLYLCITIPGAILSGSLEKRMNGRPTSGRRTVRALIPGVREPQSV